MTKDEAMKLALEKIATVNAMDYEYQAWAREALAEQALDKMAENARELGLDYEPAQRTWVGLPKSAFTGMTLQQAIAMQYAEQVLKDENT